MSDVVEITLHCRATGRLTAGFPGWDVERRGAMTVLRRLGASAGEVQAALVEVADLGLELESFHRIRDGHTVRARPVQPSVR